MRGWLKPPSLCKQRGKLSPQKKNRAVARAKPGNRAIVIVKVLVNVNIFFFNLVPLTPPPPLPVVERVLNQVP
jgi:hypothetical protein